MRITASRSVRVGMPSSRTKKDRPEAVFFITNKIGSGGDRAPGAMAAKRPADGAEAEQEHGPCRRFGDAGGDIVADGEAVPVFIDRIGEGDRCVGAAELD